MSDEQFTLHAIFAPHEVRRRADLLNNGRRLIHYTSAAAAISIIRYGGVWMRNLRVMNDYMEVDHGIQLMQRSMQPPVDSEQEKGLKAVSEAVDEIFPGLSQECFELFNGWIFHLRNKTYVTCLSEHYSSEDDFGRLSMWRSYTANQVGVGLVINPAPLYSLSETFGAFSSPVFYSTDNEMRDIFLEISKNISENRPFIEAAGRQKSKNFLFMLLRAIAMCSKHPGFHEEKEWRIMHTEGIDTQGALVLDVETINGIPQPVYKIPLRDHQESGMTGISIPNLLERVIIGPTQFPIQVWDAIANELAKVGVKDAEQRVTYSGIPLRT